MRTITDGVRVEVEDREHPDPAAVRVERVEGVALVGPQRMDTAGPARAVAEVWRRRVTSVVGRPGDGRSILLMAAVMSLSSADGGAIGALAGPLERSFHFGNTKLGLLVTVSSLVGAAGCVPMGVLVDRVNRQRLLVAAVVLWSLAIGGMSLAGSYTSLLAARVALGLVTSAAGPIVASLTGDLFPAERRASIYGLILTGDILGSGVGLLASGAVNSLADWRAAFGVLAIASLILAVVVLFRMPEPARASYGAGEDGPQPAGPRDVGPARLDGEADQRLVLRRDPSSLTAWQAARYVLSIPSNQVLILSSALGYFFLSGLRTFAVVFAHRQYGLGPALTSALIVVIGVGTLAGTVGGGRIADRLTRRGRPEGRMSVAGLGLAGAAVLFLPGLFTHSVAVALPLYVGAAALLAAPNAPIDAARLDIMPARLWGRAEAVRTLARTLLEGTAPLLFGFVSAQFSSQFSGSARNAAAGTSSPHQALTAASTHGLALTFLVMLVPLAASGLLLVHRRRRYRTDLATALMSDSAVRSAPGEGTAGGLAPSPA